MNRNDSLGAKNRRLRRRETRIQFIVICSQELTEIELTKNSQENPGLQMDFDFRSGLIEREGKRLNQNIHKR